MTFELEATNEFYFRGRTHRPGDILRVDREGLDKLTLAGVAVYVKQIDDAECAITEAPERAIRQRGRPRG